MSLLRKGVMVILDGVGDRPSVHLGNRTPLEAARTPALDALATRGEAGTVDPLFPGLPVSTSTGTGLLLGVPPSRLDRLNRGPVEAAGAGLSLRSGDVALRMNFVTVDPTSDPVRILDRRAGRIREGTQELAEALSGLDLPAEIELAVRPASQHRGVLRLSGPGLSPQVTDTDPGVSANPATIMKSRAARADEPGAVRTAEILNEVIRAAIPLLDAHPVNRARLTRGLPAANGIVTRGAGGVAGLPSLIHHLGLRATVVAGEMTVLGLGRLLGYGVMTQDGFTGLPSTDVDGKVGAALAALENSDLVFLSFKAPDICSHDGDPEAKRDFLERVDEALRPLLDRHDLAVGVTGDHSTDSTSGRHIGDPVPSLLAIPGGRRDETASYGEGACAKGGLGRVTGATAFLAMLLNGMGALDEFRPTERGFFGF